MIRRTDCSNYINRQTINIRFVYTTRSFPSFVCRILTQDAGLVQLNYFQRYRSSISQEWCGKSWQQVDNASKFLINNLTNKHRENLSKLQQFNARRRMMPQAKYPEWFVWKPHADNFVHILREHRFASRRLARLCCENISIYLYMMKKFKSVIKGCEQTFQ